MYPKHRCARGDSMGAVGAAEKENGTRRCSTKRLTQRDCKTVLIRILLFFFFGI